jgi:cyclopropane fatty-acyl-phospholipid synthase-like methyltransferase
MKLSTHDVLLLNPWLIFDIGMSEGSDRAYLANSFYVLGIEADPAMYAALEKRFAAEIVQHRLAVSIMLLQ